MSDLKLKFDAHVATNRQLLATGAYSDLVLRCADRNFHVHRAILCTKSTFFAKACEGSFSEAISGTISLVEDDPDTVVRMISHLYALEYNDVEPQRLGLENPVGSIQTTTAMTLFETLPSTNSSSSSSNNNEAAALLNNALVYGMAEKYDIPGLKPVAVEYFKSRAKECKQWPPDGFRDVVRTVYETTPESDRGLRDALVEMCYKYRNPFYINLEENYKASAMECVGFAWDLARHIHAFHT